MGGMGAARLYGGQESVFGRIARRLSKNPGLAEIDRGGILSQRNPWKEVDGRESWRRGMRRRR